jgi:hypothetical protein
MEQTTGNGILDGKHPYHRTVLLDMLEDFFERIATDEFDVFIRKELVCGDVVE